MEEMTRGLRGCAIVAGHRAIAASGETGVWGKAATRFLAAADAAREGGEAKAVHVATEDGEAYAVRESGMAMVAVTNRFTLAAIVTSDMRMILRDLAAGEVVDRRAPERGEVPAERETEEEIVEGGPAAATPAVD